MEEKKTYKDFGKVTVGHSKDHHLNESWEEQGLICQWEHCIEEAPGKATYHDRRACPIFGHWCFGGPEQADRCRNIAAELWHAIEKRFK